MAFYVRSDPAVDHKKVVPQQLFENQINSKNINYET